MVSAPAFHSSLLEPSPKSLSIHGISEPPSGTPKLAVSLADRLCCLASTRRSISRIADLGSSSNALTSPLSVPNCVSSSRMCCAPPPEAAWYVMLVIHSTKPALYSAPTPISMQLTVQLPPIQLPPLPRKSTSAFLMTGKFTGSRIITASSFMRRVDAASIQWPCQPAARSFG